MPVAGRQQAPTGQDFVSSAVDRGIAGPARCLAAGNRLAETPPEETVAEPSALEKTTLRRVSFRLLPFLMLAYLICYIDRVNAGFAALQMNKDIGLTGTVFGLGGGIFYIGYSCSRSPATWHWRNSALASGSAGS
jgi:hypothetical protein